MSVTPATPVRETVTTRKRGLETERKAPIMLEPATLTTASRVISNQLILAKVARHTPVAVLLALRPTCKLWNQAFIPTVRKEHPPIRVASNHVESLQSCGGSGQACPGRAARSRSKGVDDYIGLMNRSPDLPFTRYVVFPKTCVHQHEEVARRWSTDLDAFMTDIGGSMTYLKLEWRCDGDQHLERLRRYIFDEAPHLETLWLSVSPESVALGPINMVEADPRLVKPLPNLWKLQVDSAAAQWHLISDVAKWAQGLEELDMPGVLPIISALGASGHLHKLKALRLWCLTAQVFEALHELGRSGLRLGLLQMSVTYADSWQGADPDVGNISPPLRTFLLTQSGSLRNMSLRLRHIGNGRAPAAKPAIRIPRLGQLHTLHLERDEYGLLPLELEGSTFERCFPRLSSFTYCRVGRQRWGSGTETLDADMRVMFHPGVEDLTLTGINLAHLTRFPVLFPSVTRLEFDEGALKEVQSGTILEQWPRLISVGPLTRR